MGVMIDEVDPKLHRIAMYASKDIKAGQQLSFDYEGVVNGPFDVQDEVSRSRGRDKRKGGNKMYCYCETESCRKVIWL